MTFGQTLKQLLTISGVKAAHLAECLGYDTSYISRWISDKKMPSLKNNEELFDNISKTITKYCDEAAAERLAAIYQSDSELSLQDSITQSLHSAYRKNISATELPALVPNAVVTPNSYNLKMQELYSAAVLRSAVENQSREINCVSTTCLSKYGNKDSSFWPAIVNNPEIKGKLKIIMHQIVDVGDLCSNIDTCCAAICTYACFFPEIHYEFYLFENNAGADLIDIIIIEDNILTQNMFNHFTDSNTLLICTDKSMLAMTYAQFRSRLQACQKLLVDYTSGFSTQFLYDFFMDGYLRYLLTVMHPVYMDDELQSAWVKKYTPDISEDDFQLVYNSLCSKAPKEVLIYRSALLDYIYDGNMFIFGRQIKVDKADRIAHLEQLLKNIEHGDCRFYILNDINPILSRNDTKLNLYFSKNNGFGVSTESWNDYSYVRFTYNKAVRCFNDFLKHLMELGSEYVVCGKEAEIFIQRGLKFM